MTRRVRSASAGVWLVVTLPNNGGDGYVAEADTMSLQQWRNENPERAVAIAEAPPQPAPVSLAPPPTHGAAPNISTSMTSAFTIDRPRWVRRPSAEDFVRLYPERASERDREGRVELDCIAAADGSITCSVASENPTGWGFGEAALRLAREFRMQSTLSDGRSVAGGRTRVVLQFRLAD